MLTTFNGNLPISLEFGHCLFIVGKTIDGARRFQINLRTGKELDSDIGLHFAPQFADKIIIRNSKIANKWGTEEIYNLHSTNIKCNPIKPGEFFIICIFIGENEFHIAINNCKYCTFQYRLPINCISNIEIKDYIQTIQQIDHRIIFPYTWPPVQTINPSSIFSHDCPMLFMPGHVINITARCFGNHRGQFIIKFFDGKHRRELLHFNPRFEPHMIVVRNSMKSNLEFLNEERDGGFPFKFDEQFNLKICFTEQEFRFAVNGKRFVDFAYRKTNLLQTLVGFKIKCLYGMLMHVTEIDHFRMPDGNYENFEKICA